MRNVGRYLDLLMTLWCVFWLVWMATETGWGAVAKIAVFLLVGLRSARDYLKRSEAPR